MANSVFAWPGMFTFDGTNTIFSNPGAFPDGTVGAPSLTFSAQTTFGSYRSGSNTQTWTDGTNKVVSLMTASGLILASNRSLCWTSTADSTGSVDTFFTRGGAAAQVMFNGASGAATTSAKFLKAYSAIADNVATATMTVTIPNAAHSALLRLIVTGSLGAGGAIGANEATGTIGYDVAIARTAGVNAVATFSTAYGSATSSVAGAAAITVTAAASSISGAVGATNTFTVNVTIHAGTGSSTNHTAVIEAQLLNANATGITIA